MVLIGIFALGFLVGSVITAIVFKVRSVGSLKLVASDEDGAYLAIAWSENPNVLSRRKYVTLKVDIKNDFSQK